MKLTLAVENYRGLRKTEWRPEGVCAVVGPNGCGKTTLLSLLDFFRTAFDKGIASAVTEHAGGAAMFKNLEAPAADPVRLRLSLDDQAWEWRIPVHGALLDLPAEERFDLLVGTVMLQQQSARSFQFEGRTLQPSGAGALRDVFNSGSRHSALDGFGSGLSRLRFYPRFRWDSLQRNGSQSSADTALTVTGDNAFTVLRNWRDKRETHAASVLAVWVQVQCQARADGRVVRRGDRRRGDPRARR